MSIYKREIDRQCCNQWMNGIRTINGQYPDDNREFTILAGPGIKIEPTTAGIRITNDGDPNSFIAGDNIEFIDNGDGTVTVRLKNDQVRTGSTALTGDVAITGDVQVNGDIVQQGSAYETHAEKVFTTNDYIIMRDGAVAGLAPGDYSGFQVKLYDGVNDGRLIIDRDGVARVGDVGDEEPLLTRDESADLTDGALFKWDAANFKAINEGTVGDDTHPVKIVNGIATAVTNELQIVETPTLVYNDNNITAYKYGRIVVVSNNGYQNPYAGYINLSGFPTALTYAAALNTAGGIAQGDMWIEPNQSTLYIRVNSANQPTYGSMMYISTN